MNVLNLDLFSITPIGCFNSLGKKKIIKDFKIGSMIQFSKLYYFNLLHQIIR